MTFKIMLLMSMFICVSACDRYYYEIPPNQATPEEQAKIERAIDNISAVMTASGVQIDLRRIPIIVMPLESSGICQQNSMKDGIYIAISPSALHEAGYYPDFVPTYYSILLHEIGHCYFRRDHESELISSPEHVLIMGKSSPENPFGEIEFDWVIASVMNDQASQIISNELWNYYVLETAGVFRAKTLDDLKPYVQVKPKKR